MTGATAAPEPNYFAMVHGGPGDLWHVRVPGRIAALCGLHPYRWRVVLDAAPLPYGELCPRCAEAEARRRA